MQRIGGRITIAALLLATLCTCCGGSQEPRSTPPAAIGVEGAVQRLSAESSWAPQNREALEAFIAEVSRHDYEVRPTAVFDWDNTCVFNDVGYATLRYQLDRLVFRLTPETLGELLPAEVDGQRELTGGGVQLADARADILDAFRELWPHIQSGDLDAARALPAHRDFRAKVGWFYTQLRATEGIGATYSLPWLIGWLSGYDDDEIGEIVSAGLALAVAEPIGRATWTSATPGRIGQREFTFGTGVRPQQEMRELMTVLQEIGVRTIVVSASGELVVEEAARYFDFPIAPDDIFGIRLVVEEGRVTLRRPAADVYPVTYRQGKVDVIRTNALGDPIFVAGDADTDFEMLTSFSGTAIRLVINRNKFDDEIGALYRAARTPAADDGPVTLLQGRDENEGAFRPHQETIPLGSSEPTPLR